MTVAELDVSLHPRGRRAMPVKADFVGEIAESDLAMLAGNRGTRARPVEKLRDRHHSLARALAQGMTDSEASAITGYDPAWISSLKQVPAFQELVQHYTKIKEAAFADFQERAVSVSIDYLNHIADKLEEAPQEIGVGQALEVVKTLADRTGHAPIAKSVDIKATVDLTERLAAARRRVEASK